MEDDADAKKFTEIYRRHYDRVLAFTLRRVTAQEAREAVDDSFLVAWRRIGEVPEDVLPWLFGVVRKVLAQRRRSSQRADAVYAALLHVHSLSSGSDVSSEIAERIAVLQALHSLSETDRETLMLVAWDGLTVTRAATATGCTGATFAVRLHRARRRLRLALAIQDGGPASVPTRHVFAKGSK